MPQPARICSEGLRESYREHPVRTVATGFLAALAVAGIVDITVAVKESVDPGRMSVSVDDTVAYRTVANGVNWLLDTTDHVTANPAGIPIFGAAELLLVGAAASSVKSLVDAQKP